MSEIRRIEINNFQSHARTAIEPAPAGGLTVITGPSDSGKTAIVRALKWVLYNQPQGDGFRRVGCDYVEVSAETGSGQHVTRRRTSTTNRYIVDGETLEGFGSSVPAEAQQATGVRPVRLNDQDILANIAGQLDAPFLGNSISAPARAKVLGKLAGTEVIDQANKDLGTDLYRSRQEVKRLEAEIEKLKEQVAQYDHLPSLADKIERLRELCEQIRTAQERMNRLAPYRRKLQGLGHQRSSLLAVLRSLGDPEQAAVRWSKAEGSITRRRQLTKLMSQLTEVAQQVEALQTSIVAMGDSEQATAKLEEAQRDQATLQKLIPLATSLKALRKTTTEAYETVSRTSGTEDALTGWQTARAAASKLSQLQRLHGSLIQATNQHKLLSAQLATSNQIASLEVPMPELDLLRQLRVINSRLNDTKQALNKTLGVRELAAETLDKAMQLYSETLKEAGKCPLCGSEIQDDCIKEVLSA